MIDRWAAAKRNPNCSTAFFEWLTSTRKCRTWTPPSRRSACWTEPTKT